MISRLITPLPMPIDRVFVRTQELAYHAFDGHFLGQRLPAPPPPREEPALGRGPRLRAGAAAGAGAGAAQADGAAAAAQASTADAAGVRVALVPVHRHPALPVGEIEQLLQVKNLMIRRALVDLPHRRDWRGVRSRLIPERDAPLDLRRRAQIHELHVHLPFVKHKHAIFRNQAPLMH